MEEWVEETAMRRSMVVSRTTWWRWMLKGAVEAVEGRLVGIDGSRKNTGRVPERRRRKTRGVVIGAYGGTWCIRWGSGRNTGRRKPRPDR